MLSTPNACQWLYATYHEDMHRFVGAVLFFVVVLLPFLVPYSAHAQFPFYPKGGLVPCGNNIRVTTDEWDGPPNQAGSNQYLCIYDECTTCGLVTLAQNLLMLAVFMAVVIAAIMFAYAGALYLLSSSNPGNISKAHSIFWDVLLGLVLVLAGWMVIDVIMKVLYGDGPQGWGPWNEILCGYTAQRDCRVLEKPRAGTAGAPSEPTPKPGERKPPPGDGSKYPGEKGCPAPTSGWCSVARLEPYFGENAYMAAGICAHESVGGNPNTPSGADLCLPSRTPASWGLFQINITANTIDGLNCPQAFTAAYTARNHVCAVKSDERSQQLFRDCVAAAKDPVKNIRKAVEMSHGGRTWGPWGANCRCHFPPWRQGSYDCR